MTFSMLITDIHMPGQRSGIHIARLMRQFNPELPIIFTTGRPDMISRFGPLGRNETLITKPYRAPELVEAILALLTD